MAIDPSHPNYQPPRKRGLGCFAKGCLTLVVVGILTIALVGVFIYKSYQQVRSYLADAPVPIRIYPATDEQYQAVQAKLAPFFDAIASNHRTTVELTADDLNTLIAREPGFSDVRGKVAISMAGGYLAADFSRMISDSRETSTALYLNGRATAAINVDNGEVQLSPHTVTLNGKALPAWITQLLNNRDFMKSSGGILDDEINRKPQLREFLRRLHSAHVDGDRLVLTSVGEPVAATPAAP